MIRAWLLTPLLAACTGEDGLQEEQPDTVSCEAEWRAPSSSPPQEIEMVFVISDRVAMAAYQDSLAAQISLAGRIFETNGWSTHVLVVDGASGCTAEGPPDVDYVGMPWFTCDDASGVCHERNFTGSLADTLACAADVPRESTQPNALIDRLESVLDDPVLAADDTFLFVVFVTTEDDASSATPLEHIPRLRAMRTWRGVIVATVGGSHTPRLDAFRAGFPDRNFATSIDQDDWADIVLELDNGWGHVANPCLQLYDGEAPLFVSEQGGAAIPRCLMATDTRPLATTPLPCYRLVQDDATCPEVPGQWALWVERARHSTAFAEVRYACAP